MRTAAATVAVLSLAACTGPSADEEPVELRPVSSSGSWNQSGSSDTAAVRPLPVEGGWGPTDAEIERARALVGGLSLRERAGQVIVASYAGTGAPTGMVNGLHLGGVLPFSANVAGAAQITRSNKAAPAVRGPGRAEVARADRRRPGGRPGGPGQHRGHRASRPS